MNMMNDNFYKNFYQMCQAIGVTKQLSEAGFLETEGILSAKGSEQIVKADIDLGDFTWCQEYQEKFSKNNIGITGKKSDIVSIIKKMKRFMIMFGHSPDIILKATDRYISDNKHKPQFIREADYVIFKKEGTEERSTLAGYCEDIGSGDDNSSTSEGWGREL